MSVLLQLATFIAQGIGILFVAILCAAVIIDVCNGGLDGEG